MKKLLLLTLLTFALTGCLEISLDPTVDATVLTSSQFVILGTVDGTITAFNADTFECLYGFLYGQDLFTMEILDPVIGIDTLPATCTSTDIYTHTVISNTTIPLYATPAMP